MARRHARLLARSSLFATAKGTHEDDLARLAGWWRQEHGAVRSDDAIALRIGGMTDQRQPGRLARAVEAELHPAVPGASKACPLDLGKEFTLG